MKKWKLKLMKQAAAALPQGKQMRKMLGADILKLNPDTRDKDGNTLDPKQTYMHPVQKDNYRAVKKYFKNPDNKKELDSYKK